MFIGVKPHPQLRREGVTIHSGALALGAHVPTCCAPHAEHTSTLRCYGAGPLASVFSSPCSGSLGLLHPGSADVEISYVDAILGTTVKVATLGERELSEVDLKIPPGKPPGRAARGQALMCCRRPNHPARRAPAAHPFCEDCAHPCLRREPCVAFRAPRVLLPDFLLPSCRHAARHHAGHVQAWRAQARHPERKRRPLGACQGTWAAAGPTPTCRAPVTERGVLPALRCQLLVTVLQALGFQT